MTIQAGEMCAQDTVMRVAELLELILANLPPTDIFRYQRVSKAWHQLITQSPLLQYKSWLRDDCSGSAHHVQFNDPIPELERKYYKLDGETDREERLKVFDDHMTRHLHPVVAARIVQHRSRYFHGSVIIDPNQDPKEEVQASLPMEPQILRALMNWYKEQGDSRHKWAHISLFRPEVSRVRWQVGNSDGSGTNFTLRIVENRSWRWDPNTTEIVRSTPSMLTVGDLMEIVGSEWKKWIEWQYEVHYLSHDSTGCRFEHGIPPLHCLIEGEHYDEEEDEDEDRDDHDNEVEGKANYESEDIQERMPELESEMEMYTRWAISDSCDPYFVMFPKRY